MSYVRSINSRKEDNEASLLEYTLFAKHKIFVIFHNKDYINVSMCTMSCIQENVVTNATEYLLALIQYRRVIYKHLTFVRSCLHEWKRVKYIYTTR